MPLATQLERASSRLHPWMQALRGVSWCKSARAAPELLEIVRRAGLIDVPGPRALSTFARGLLAGEHMLSTMLRFNALERPHKEAIVDDRTALTYGALDRRVNRVSRLLAELGVRRGSSVAVMLPNRIEILEVALASARLGARYTPIGASLKKGEVAYILDHSRPAVLVTDGLRLTNVDERSWLHTRILVVGEMPDENAPPDALTYERRVSLSSSVAPPLARAAAENTVVLYTSGTTGAPKGAQRDIHLGALDQFIHMLGAFDLSRRDRFFLSTPLYHAGPWAFSHMILGLGATLVVSDRWRGVETLERMSSQHVTGMLVVPTLIRHWLDLPPRLRRHHHPRRLTKVISVGAAFPAAWKVEASETIGEIFYDFYGATELGAISVSTPRDTRVRPDTVGRPLPYVELILLDESGDPVSQGERGELYARGQTFGGYLEDAEATDAASRDGFFSVGDIAFVDADGYLHVVDRVIDMVISGGVNIYPAEVEAALLTHPGIADAAVVGVSDDTWGESLHAFVVRRAGSNSLDSEAVVAHCEALMARYKRPKGVTFVDVLPRSPQGKVQKRALRKRAERA